MRHNQQAAMDQLEQNQAALHKEVPQVRAQMGQVMEIIQAVARGQEIMAKMQEMNQRAHAANATPNAHPPVVENPIPPHGNIPVHILVGAPGGVPPVALNPPVIEVDDQ